MIDLEIIVLSEVRERQIYIAYIWNLQNDSNELKNKTDSQVLETENGGFKKLYLFLLFFNDSLPLLTVQSLPIFLSFIFIILPSFLKLCVSADLSS